MPEMTVSAVPSAQPAFPCGRNQQVWFRKTGSALSAALLSLGVVVDLWLDTSVYTTVAASYVASSYGPS